MLGGGGHVLGILFAILSALGFGTGQFLIQLGLRRGRLAPLQGLLVNLVAANFILFCAFIVSTLVAPVQISWIGIAYFVAAGIAAPFAGRTMNFLAIPRIGATRTASLGMSESIFAAVIALLVLGQRPSLLTAVGIVVLIVGTVMFLRESRRTFAPDRSTPGAPASTAESLSGAEALAPNAYPAPGKAEEKRALTAARAGVIFGLVAGLFFGVAGVLRQLGIDAFPSAIMGSAIGTFVALAVTLVNVLRSGRLSGLRRISLGEAVPLAFSGVVASAGMLAFFLALQFEGTVAVSTALKNMTPLFTFALAGLFLAGRERLSVHLAGLVLLVVFGAALTALGRF